MAVMKNILEQAAQRNKMILQGNVAFALGVIHAGFHAADGYPGTPSTEVMEHLLQVPERLIAGWSVNEAVAVGVGVGHAIAGRDAVVTMKVPGLFQAADVVASAAASESFSGALVLFVATDHAPSSSQYLVDSRYFLSSLYVPIIEPRNHQDLYQSAGRAAWLSREYQTPVVVLCSSALCHSEGMVLPGDAQSQQVAPWRNSSSKVLLPRDARRAFEHAVTQKIPAVETAWNSLGVQDAFTGRAAWGIIACGEAELIVREVLNLYQLEPAQLFLGVSYPLPMAAIRVWWQRCSGPVILVEDGERFVENLLRQQGFSLIGKEKHARITHWTPDDLIAVLKEQGLLKDQKREERVYPISAFERFPALCPGCPYQAVSLVLQKLKRQDKLDLVFGDIGCSTLLCYQNALDINLCMGASEAMRQGYVLSQTEAMPRVISLIGDSSECHSGLAASRNAKFRRIPGVKVVLDNRAVAMTGGQVSPTSSVFPENSSLQLERVLAAEGIASVSVDAYHPQQIQDALEDALNKAGQGEMRAVIVVGKCLEVADRSDFRESALVVDETLCSHCGLCNICPAIDFEPGQAPLIRSLCSRCGDGDELCVQRCPTGALRVQSRQPLSSAEPFAQDPAIPLVESDFRPILSDFPDSLRLLICGVGGQGNLFLGKLLTHVMQATSYSELNIIKGEVHGMAQKGGCVYSTFGCGHVYSPIFAEQSVDLLVAMERHEILRSRYLKLLKPGGKILLNDCSILPLTMKSHEATSLDEIRDVLTDYEVICLDANAKAPRHANVFILGVLSQLYPFEGIAFSHWADALRECSKNLRQYEQNLAAFQQGRGVTVSVSSPE